MSFFLEKDLQYLLRIKKMMTPSWSNVKLPLKNPLYFRHGSSHHITVKFLLPSMEALELLHPIEDHNFLDQQHRLTLFKLSKIKQLPCVFLYEAYESHGHFAIRFGLR